MKPLISIISPIASRSGYGSMAFPFVYNMLSLYKDEYDFELIDINWGMCPRTELDRKNEITELIKKYLVKGFTRQPDIHFHISVPFEYQRLGKQFNVGYTAGIETTICHVSWLEGLNRMDYNLVTSEHIKKVFLGTNFNEQAQNGQIIRSLKCERPVDILFIPVDCDIFDNKKYNKDNEINKNIDNIKEEFCFLFVGHWTQGEFGQDRKNIGPTIKAFLETFKNKEKKPALILKTSGATFSYIDRTEIIKKINEIRVSVGEIEKQPNIYLIHGDLEPEEMNNLYCNPKIKAMINLTHGEGFGIPLLEFSLTGKPIIASAWSGHLDFLPKENTFLIGGKVEQIHQSSVVENLLIKESGWFYPDINIAAATMNDIFNHYSKYTKMSYQLGIDNRKKYNLLKQKDSIKDFFDKIIIPEINKIPKQMEVKLPQIKKFQLPKLVKV